MYIRRVRVPSGSRKSQNVYYNLVESVRTPEGSRQRLVLSLGKLDLDPSLHKLLAKRIEDMLVGRSELFETDSKIDKLAQYYSDRIFTLRAKTVEKSTREKKRNFQSVDVDSMDASNVRSLGPEYVGHMMWKELNIDKVLIKKGVPKNLIPIAEALILGRLIHPKSERGTREWVENTSSLFEISGNPTARSLNAYYRTADLLYGCKNALEKHLAQRERDLFSLSESIVLYDLTNTYFEGQCAKNSSAAYGRSKEKRSDCKLATMGLVVDGDGFPKYSRFYPGNQSEPQTFQDIVLSLEAQTGIKEGATIVMDAGIASQENVDWLKSRGNSYVVVHRGKHPDEMDAGDKMDLIRKDIARGVRIEIRGKDVANERYILVKSEMKRRKEESMASRSESLFIERLQYWRDGLDKPRRLKTYESILRNIGRLTEKYPRAARLYHIEVEPGEKDKRTCKIKTASIKWTKKEKKETEAQKKQGTYLLRTNRKDWTDKKIWETYIMLGRIEKSFRDMKSHLGFRPNFHQSKDRVESHMFISVLAYHLMHSIERKLRLNGDNRNWDSIKSILKTHCRVTLEYIASENGELLKNSMRTNSRPEKSHRDIYKKLGLSGKDLDRQLMKYKISGDNRKS